MEINFIVERKKYISDGKEKSQAKYIYFKYLYCLKKKKVGPCDDFKSAFFRMFTHHLLEVFRLFTPSP